MTSIARLAWLFTAILASTSPAWAAPSSPTKTPSCQGNNGYSASFGGRRTFGLHPTDLEAIKASLANDQAIAEAYRALLNRADKALMEKPTSVVDKRSVPPSGNRHDYMSLAPYWWPDPGNSKGAYIRRDGDVNPERDTSRFDRSALGRMVRNVDALALAYHYSGQSKYAKSAAASVRAWFLDPTTGMNPNMNFAQAVPGQSLGRPEGVLETSGFIGVIDAVGLIGPSGALTDAETRALERWFSRYIDWMRESPSGKAEGTKSNNHGIWYDAQLARFALFARRSDIAQQVVAAFPKKRIEQQFDPSGSLPAELVRTRSFHYSLYALEAAYDVADSARCLGFDIYNYQGSGGRSLRKATDYVAVYRGSGKNWPHKEMVWPGGYLDEMLVRADSVWGPDAYPHGDGGDVLLRYNIR